MSNRDLPTIDDLVDHDGGVRDAIDELSSEAASNDTPEETDMDADGARLISADVSCRNCAHRNVCSLLKGIEPMLEQHWPQSKPPIDASELAVICDEYSPDNEVDG